MKSFCFFVVMFIATSKILAQGIGVWKNYTDMRSTRDIAVTGNNIWAATEGGVFKYDLTSREFETFTKSEELSSQNITAINIDGDGKIWVGSEEGFINVFNPTDNSINKILDIYSTDKTQKQINKIVIDGSNVYVATNFGLSIINSQTLTFNETILKFGNFLSESKVNNITAGNTIYVTTENGIAVLKPGAVNLSAPESWNTYSIGTNIPVTSVYEVAEFQGSVIASTDRGIYRLENNLWSSYLFAGQNINDITVNENLLYVLLSNSLYKVTGTGDEQIYNSSSTVLNSLFVQNEQNIYIASNNGVQHLANENVTEIIPNGPNSNLFINLSVDKNGNLWAATGNDKINKGFYKFDGSNWTNYNKNTTPVLKTDAYHNVYTASDNSVYIGSWGGGYAKFQNESLEIYDGDNTELIGVLGENSNYIVISAIEEDLNKNIWFVNFLSSSEKPLSVLTSENKWFHYSFPSPKINSRSESILLAIDRNNTKWFAVQPGFQGGTPGLYYYNENSTFETTSDDAYGYLNEASGLNSSNISSIVVDKRGEVWVGTSLGINVIPNPASPKTGIRNVLPVRFETISTIAVDPINQKWVGTQNGIFVLTSDGIRVVAEYSTSNSPLPTNTIRSIAFDEKNGIAYIGTDFGLTTLTTSSIEPQEQFDELFVFPNPFVIDGSGDNQITIDGLVRDSQVKVLSITGKLIKEFASPGGRVAFWNGRDENGDLVSSGVYIIVAYDTEATNVAKSKVAVIRK